MAANYSEDETRAGKLRHALMLQRYIQTQDEIGQPIEAWVDQGIVRASVEGVTGREYLAAQQDRAATTWRITTRFRDDIDQSCRFVEGERIYNVKAAMPDNRCRQLTLMCETA